MTSAAMVSTEVSSSLGCCKDGSASAAEEDGEGVWDMDVAPVVM
jgi:hypothetical protein